MKTLSRLSVILLFLMLVTLAVVPVSAGTVLPTPKGNYLSDCLVQANPDGSTSYMRLNWLFVEPNWSLVYTVYAKKPVQLRCWMFSLMERTSCSRLRPQFQARQRPNSTSIIALLFPMPIP